MIMIILLMLVFASSKETVEKMQVVPTRIHNELYNLMQTLDSIFKRYNVDYFITCGTLLGSVREGKIIEWDDDIDLMVIASDQDMQRLVPHIQQLGYSLEKRDHIWRFEKTPDSVPYIDIFLGEREGDKIVDSEKFNRERFTKNYFFVNELYPQQKYRLGPLTLDGPNQYLDYLVRMYGEGWKTPKYSKPHNTF